MQLLLLLFVQHLKTTWFLKNGGCLPIPEKRPRRRNRNDMTELRGHTSKAGTLSGQDQCETGRIEFGLPIFRDAPVPDR